MPTAWLPKPLSLACLDAAADNELMPDPDWSQLDLQALTEELRATLSPSDAEKMVWAFEQALAAARIDGELLRCLLAATASLVAGAEESSPRAVFEAFFRRSVSDDQWRKRYAGLIA